MAMILLPPDFKDFLRLLNSENVEYLLLGGYAVGYYGYPRATGDMDVWIASKSSNIESVLRVLKQFGFSSSSVGAEMFAGRNRVIRMGVPPLRIELLTDVSGLEFASCYGRRHLDVIDGVEVSLISLDDLKANKRASGRPKDRNDLENLS